MQELLADFFLFNREIEREREKERERDRERDRDRQRGISDINKIDIE